MFHPHPPPLHFHSLPPHRLILPLCPPYLTHPLLLPPPHHHRPFLVYLLQQVLPTLLHLNFRT